MDASLIMKIPAAIITFPVLILATIMIGVVAVIVYCVVLLGVALFSPLAIFASISDPEIESKEIFNLPNEILAKSSEGIEVIWTGWAKSIS
jgi:hypothetical protein